MLELSEIDLLRAKVESLEESISHLKDCVWTALNYGTVRPDSESGTRAAEILEEEWPK